MAFAHTNHKRSVGPKFFGIARQIEGAVSADAAPFTFAQYDPLIDDMNTGILPGDGDPTPVTGIFLGGSKHDTLLVGACFSGGGTIRIQPRIADLELEAWIPVLDNTGTIIQSPVLKSMTDAGGEGGVWEFHNFGDRVFFFVQDITGTVEDLEIVVRPGRPRVAPYFP